MGKLFDGLVNEGLMREWASLLDWIFDDEKFSNWTSGYVGSLSKKIKKMPNLNKKNYLYDSAKKLPFDKKPDDKSIKVLLGKKDGVAKDFIRHIRNGIAHGKTNIIKKAGVLYIEIVDYSKGNQTAYIFMPISYITEIHKLYNNVKKSYENRRK